MGILDDKVTVVTGAARGIGRATLEVFLEEGARVVATDIDGDALSRMAAATGCDADRLVMVVGDVSGEADADAMIEAATQTWNRLDCLVANAGVIPSAPSTRRPSRTGTTSWRSTAEACSSPAARPFG